jgi:hypothetical protein
MASANYTYTYTGNTFELIGSDGSGVGEPYTTEMFVSGYFTLADPIGPLQEGLDVKDIVLDAAFSDGANTNTFDSASFALIRYLWTDEHGVPTNWQIALYNDCGVNAVCRIQTRNDSLNVGGALPVDVGDQLINGSVTQIARVPHNPGTWTVTPEPATGAMLTTGLIALALRRR